MPLPNEDTVRGRLEVSDRDLKIRDAIERAWAEVQEKYPDRAWWRRATTLRHVMWEHMVDRVMEVVSDDRGLKAVTHHDTASFIADDAVLFRLKKADRQFTTTNYPTPLANLFHQHTADLFGHEGHHRVEVVHIFNRFRTALDWIGVVARDGKRVIWEFELRRREGDVVAFPVPAPAPAGKKVVRVNIPAADDASQQNQ